MRRYALQRMVQVIPVAFILSIIVFGALYLVPGDPTSVVLGSEPTPEAIEALREEWGLNDSVLSQYAHWLGNMLTGDFGASLLSGRPVSALVADALPVTAELATLSLLVALLIAVPIAIIAGMRAGTWIDTAFQSAAFVGLSIPSFWLGILLIDIFAVNLGWFPTGGFVPISEDVSENLKSMALPSITLGVFLATQLMRYLRAGIVRVRHEPYVRTAHAKGLARRKVLRRHILRNALIPFVTVLGVQFGFLIGGTVVIETLFSLPGMGRLALQGLSNRDYQVVTSVVFILACAFLLVNLCVDLLYGFLDPRLRRSPRASA